mgnify:CR=1 FL=1
MLEALGFLGERELIYDVVEDTELAAQPSREVQTYRCHRVTGAEVVPREVLAPHHARLCAHAQHATRTTLTMNR